MKIFIFLVLSCLTSCAVFDKYGPNENEHVLTLLSDEEWATLNSKGELFKTVDRTNPSIKSYYKGTYRILKTSKPDFFNIFSIGKCIEEWPNGSNGKHLGFINRDTIFYDSLGNIRSRLIYQETKKGSGQFRLYNKISSKVENGELLQTFNIINDRNVVVSEWVWKSPDQDTPGDGIKKKKVKTGKQTNYYPDGKLAAILYFNDKGKVTKKEKFPQ